MVLTILMEIVEFERTVLNRSKKQSDRDLLKRVSQGFVVLF